jgi:hypothetical protein
MSIGARTMKIFKLILIEPTEIFIVRDESKEKAIFLVRNNIELEEASEITGIGDTPKPSDYRIKECKEDFSSPYSRDGKREILSHTIE